MLISLDWIKDYIDLPSDLDPRQLAERFTVTTAEVEGVRRIAVGAEGLMVAGVQAVEPIADNALLKAAVLDLGGGKTAEVVTAAPVLRVGDQVIYAPPGASVSKLGVIHESTVAGRKSAGMILPGDALGMELAAQDAVFVAQEFNPGDAVDAKLFDDWIIEVDNKSLTHRPDLWGHYGIAREIAAMLENPLNPYPVVAAEELKTGDLPALEISIADNSACRRYTGIVLQGVPVQPAPLGMQLRLGRVGLRPISGLVDLTNYIMTDLGQPMHAFDATNVHRIEVDWACEGESFQTLDGVQRKLTGTDLMIQCDGKSVAVAGVMGGAATEVSESTESLLLESANFDPAIIRRTAGRLGLRTDASARFEKSLDPAHTLLSVQRFIHLARKMYPELAIKSRLTDCFPSPPKPVHVSVNPKNVARMVGSEISAKRATEILQPLGFGVTTASDTWRVDVPSYRAAKDVAIEADIIEEITRCVGFGNIAPAMPRVAMRRFEPNALHQVQKKTLQHFTQAEGFNEVYGYLWYDAAWLATLGVDPGPCVELKNPAAAGLERLRQSLLPGLLAAANRNRHHFPGFSLIEVGSVFEPGTPTGGGDPRDQEYHRVGLLCAARGRKTESQLVNKLKSALESWAWQAFARPIAYAATVADPLAPWQHPRRTTSVNLDGDDIGRISVLDAPLKRRIDEHLNSWSLAWAELRLDPLASLNARAERLSTIPEFPVVEMDFSFVVPAATDFAEVIDKIRKFQHPKHRQTRFVDSYEGQSVGPGKRSLTFRLVAGDEHKTLSQADTDGFHAAFESHLKGCGYEIRT